MKYLIFVLLLLTSLSGFSQDKDPLHLFDSTSKVATFDSVYRDVKGALEGLASGLKTTGDHVYTVLLRQQLIEAIEGLFIWLITFCFILCFAHYIKKPFEDEYGDTTREGAIACIFGVVSGVFIIASFCWLNPIITGLFNPEYGALKVILDAIK
jgi:hypothetical protein